MKIYYRWCADTKYEFYIDTGRRKYTPDLHSLELSYMISIYIVGGGKVSNKRGRLKKRLMSPPKGFVIGTGETWCWLTGEERKHYLEVTEEELKNILIDYGLNNYWTWNQ